jgi:phospholipase C
MFKQFASGELHRRGVAPIFPNDFERDVATGRLPQVSWIYAFTSNSEHPPAPVEWGQYTADSILRTLTSRPDVWRRTAFFITWDENGGFFDHVAPRTPPAGTPGEYLTTPSLPAAAAGVRGPIGLGFRVPLLIVSPYSRGGLVCSERFDHTSLLRFLETRFGVEVPNLSAWRRSVTGDLTAAFNFAASPDASVPRLPATSLTDPRVVASDCALEVAEKFTGAPLAPVYPVPANALPEQEPGSPRRPSGCPAPKHVHKRVKLARRRRKTR